MADRLSLIMKSTIRREMIARRNSITREEMMAKSELIQKRLMGLPAYLESKTIVLYANFDNEVSTSMIFDEALKDGKKVLFPCIREVEKELVFFPVRGRNELKVGPFGISAPKYVEDRSNSIGEAGLLLIPGVAYDLTGGRIGYGGGFYDRSLGKLTELPFIAAMAYEFQVLDSIPLSPHDVRVDAIITERRVIVC